MSGPAAAHSPPSVRELLVVGLLSLVAMTAAVFVFFGAGVLEGSRLFFTNEIFGSDFWHLNYPFRHFYAAGLAEGRLPLWCPDLGLGYPLLADGQLGALYPLNLLLYSLLPLPVALNWEILLHLILAGAFAAMFARQVGAGRWTSLLAAIVYGLCGFFLVHLKHANMLIAGAWFPLILLLMERYAASRRAVTLALLAIVIGASAVGGHPQVAYNNLLLAAFYAVWLLVKAGRRPREEGGGAPGAGRLGAGLLLAVGLGALLAGPQLLPSWELKRLGPRGQGLSAGEATYWDLEFEDLALFLRPKLHGDPGRLVPAPALDPETGEQRIDPRTGRPIEMLVGFDSGGRIALFWEMTAYVGLLPLLLALLGLILTRPRAHSISLALLLILAVVLALGRGAGLFLLLRSVVPGFDLFRFPSRFLLYADFAIAVLAALGMTAAARRIPRRLPRWTPALLLPAVLVVSALDIRLALGDHNPQVSAERWLRPPPAARRIRSEEAVGGGTPFRIATVDPERWVFINAYHLARGWHGDLLPYEHAWNSLDPNLSLLFGIDNVHVFSPVAIRWATEVTHLLFLPPKSKGGLTGGVDPKIAAILNVRYFIDPFGVLQGRLEALAEYPGGVLLKGSLLVEAGPPFTIRLYRNPLELPRAFLVPRARLTGDEVTRPGMASAVQVALLSPDFDPRVEVLIAGGEPLDDPGPNPPSAPIDRPVEILEYTPHLVRLRADAPHDCWLFLSDNHYPGWVAEVDGEVTPIRRANLAGRAVRLPSGRHEVVFRYRPSSFIWGVGAFSVAAIALLALLLFGQRGRTAARRLERMETSRA